MPIRPPLTLTTEQLWQHHDALQESLSALGAAESAAYAARDGESVRRIVEARCVLMELAVSTGFAAVRATTAEARDHLILSALTDETPEAGDFPCCAD